jgi:hypothetical protein
MRKPQFNQLSTAIDLPISSLTLFPMALGGPPASAAPGPGGKPLNMPIEVREVMSAPPVEV